MPALARFARFARAHVWVLPILLFAFYLRMVGLGEEHMYGDEAEYAIVARYLARDLAYLAYPDITNVGATPFVSQPPLVLYLMALSMKVFGPTDFAAYFPNILFGVAAVAAVYAIGHRLGGRFMGLAAAAVLAGMPFHAEMSRRAMLDAGYSFFLVLTAYFTIAWLQDRRRHQALGIGIAVACAALSKLPGVLAAPVALLVFLTALVVAIARRDWKQTKETLLQGGIGVAPVVMGAGLYLGLLAHLQALGNLWLKLVWQMGRVDTSRAVANEITAVHRDASWYFTDPEFSLQESLMPIVFAVALVGLLALLLRILVRWERRPEAIVVPLLTFTLLAFFTWSDRKEGFYLLPLAPFAAIFVAHAGDALRKLLAWGGLRLAPERFQKPVPVVALIAGILVIGAPAYAGANETVDDFVRGNDQEKYWGSGTREAAEFIAARDPDAGQYGTLLGRWALHWYNEQTTYHWYLDHTHMKRRIEAGELRYIVYEQYINWGDDNRFMLSLIADYNGKPVETIRHGWGEVTVYELHPR